jgi:hypothetical protein
LHANLTQRGLVVPLQEFAQKQPFWALGRDIADKLCKGTLQGVGHLQEHQYGGIPEPVLKVGEMPV